MKSVIPFTKELDFSTKVSEITSISLEREFEVKETSIDGNLFVTGDYKSHEVSANVIPFSYKIPFTIEIPDNLNKDSLSLEISDFAYDSKEESTIVVNIELELHGDILEAPEQEEEVEQEFEVDTEEILQMLSSEREEESDSFETVIEDDTPQVEEVNSLDLEKKEENLEERAGEEEMILENVSEENEYATYHIHIVKNGETVETICTMYQSNLSLLSEYNDLTTLDVGEKLIIPENDES